MDDERKRMIICRLIALIDLALWEGDVRPPESGDLPADGKFFLNPGSPAP
jgi:hypothetical protein